MTCKYLGQKTTATCCAGALFAFVFGIVCVCGCEKEAPQDVAETTVEPASSYMNDPAYAAAKADIMAARANVVAVREKLISEMTQRAEAMRAKMPGADEATVKAALEKDPEWNSLAKRMEDANAAYEDNLSKAHKLIGDRIAPKKISK